jgi:transcriptional regulator with XRE-family HTH domain
MKLSRWRAYRKLTLSEAAALVGVTPVAFGRYERGRVPDPSRLQKIIEVTEGDVTANDFFEIPSDGSLSRAGASA